MRTTLLVAAAAMTVTASATASVIPANTFEKIINRGAAPSLRVEIPDLPSPLLDAIRRSTVMLMMQSTKGETSLCTGSVIAQHIVLTAAHCVEEGPAHLVVAFYDGQDNMTTRFGTLYTTHPGYSEPPGNDLALVYFEGSIPKGHAPAKLVRSPEAFLDSYFLYQKNTIAGYGVTAYQAGDAGTLHKTELTFSGHIEDTVALMDIENGSSACNGDSGGPAFVYYEGQYQLWGVASFVDAPLCENHSYYTVATQHLDWIDKTSSAMVKKMAGR